MKPRVLTIVTDGDRGGAQRHVGDLLEQLSGEFAFTLAAGRAGALTARAAALGVPTVLVPDLVSPLAPARDLHAYRRVLALLRDLRPDLVATHSSKAGALGRLAAHRLQIPSVYTAHGLPFKGQPAPARAVFAGVERFLAARTGRLVAVSREDYDLLAAMVGPGRVRLIRNGVPEAPLATHRPRGVFGVLMRLVPGRDLTPLFEAMARLGAQVVVGGFGSQEEAVRRAADRAGVLGRLRFLGWVDDPEAFFAGVDGLVHLSRKEGMPYAVLEAGARGIPVIASPVGGIPEVVPRPWLVSDAGQLSRAMAGVLERPRETDALRRRLQARIRSACSLAEMCKRTRDTYRELVGSRSD